MKWRTLLQDLKDKVGVAETTAELNVVSDPPTPPSSSASPSSINAVSAQHDFNSLSPTSRDKRKLELDFTRYWEVFRSSSSEQEKEAALNLSVNTFCRLVKQHANVDQLVTILVETHVFSFVIGRAFVTDVEKLKISSKTRSLDVEKVLKFFSEVTKEGSSHGANLLTAVEVLASGPFDKQSLLDSGILCCLIHILNALLTYSEGEKTVNAEEKVVGNVVHIMKALASHPSAAQSLIEDDSFELLFKMVYNGSLVALSQYKEGLVSLHNIQLHRHAMQILGLLLVNDNGSTASYIRKHHLNLVIRRLRLILLEDLVETHVFSFVIGRAFVTDVEKLKISSKTRSLDVEKVLKFFSEVTKEGSSHGANLLTAVEVLASGPFDKQSLLDSGILCCLIHILNALLTYSEGEKTVNAEEKVVGNVVHIMKALASHPSAAQSLIEDDSFELLFKMVYNGSLVALSQYKEGLVSLHNIQLHRHAMQILGLLLVNDNGSTASYIRKHHLIKVLLVAVKDFDPDCGDSSYTMGIVDLLLECVELSYRPETGGVRLKEDIRNAHGYHFLVQFALVLSSMRKDMVFAFNHSSPHKNSGSDDSENQPPLSLNSSQNDDRASQNFSPSLSRLLDVLVTLAQTGPIESPGASTSLFSYTKPTANNLYDEDHGNGKVKDLEAVQMLQDIFLKAENKDLQAEVLNRMFKIFTSHMENYRMCQELRTVPLLVLNMGGFPASLQELILKILEYAVTVVNCVPEQELLSLCFLLQQPINSELKHTILSFFVKLTSFDLEYKKVLGEVGVLEVLQDDLKQCKLLMGPDQHSGVSNYLDRVPSSPSFKQHLDSKDAIISSPKRIESGSGKFHIFQVDSTITVGWDCMISLLKKSEANQAAFRSANGVTVILPFLISDEHRTGVLRILSCLITEDIEQVHHEELEAVIDVLKSGMVTGISGHQYKLYDEARCDTMGALWRILGVNGSAQRVFGEATGFSLLLTTLHTFQGEEECRDESLVMVFIKLFRYLLRLMTTAACDNSINRMKLHSVITSQIFYDLVVESGLLCADLETQVIQLFLELALEVVLPPFLTSESMASAETAESVKASFLVKTPSGQFNPDKQRIYNAGAVRVLIRSLLLFTPKMQLEFLNLLERLARASPFNLENLTSAGCVELLLEIIQPFLPGSSPFLSHALKIVEVLGAYRLSPSELKLLCRYVMQMRAMHSGHSLVGMMEKLILMEDTSLEDVSLAPFVEMDMSKTGCASVQVSLGERSWPPAAGYSFVCWFQYCNFLTTQGKESEVYKAGGASKTHSLSGQQSERNVFRIFSVSEISDESQSYAELYFQEDGILTLATSNSNSLSFSGLETEKGKWHHLVVVHSKPNALAGLFQASVAYVYIDGKLRHMGKLGYSPSPVGKSLQVIIGTPATCARVSNLAWKIRSCYLFEEVLTSGCIGFMYILGRGYKGLFQDAHLLCFVPNQACGGGSMAILDFLDTDMTWLKRLENLSIQLPGKKLIFAFDGTCSEFLRTTGSFSLLNLVDPLSAAASLIGGIPRFGRLVGNASICRQNVVGDTIRSVGGMAVVLALVEASESRDMIYMSLSLLACVLHQNSQNVKDMETYRGYHLLALFLRPKMALFDMKCLEILFQISACEAFFSEPKKLGSGQSTICMSPTEITPENNYEDLSLSNFQSEPSSVGSHGYLDDFSGPKDSFSHLSELEIGDSPVETSNCIVLSNADMVEHVLLDWTLWVTAPVSIQIALLDFLENLVSMLWYRSHNLTILRQINLVEHLLVTLQRGDVEVLVLEKLVIFLGFVLQDGFLTSELESVVRFVIMTFNPPEIKSQNSSMRESMGKHVIVRNLLLEMLIDLQVTIKAEELLERWHKIVSSKLLTYFLDEVVHPSSMRWIMTLLGVCLTSSLSFSLIFFSSGGYQGLARVLQSFYDSPDIYYILFCLIFGKPVFPRLPEVRMLDFHELMPGDGSHVELKFVDLLDSVVAMAKSTFERLSMQSMLAHHSGNLSQVRDRLVDELVEGNAGMTGDLQGEALIHKTYAARLMGGEASAPATATSVIRFMVDLAKMCPQFSAACRCAEFLQNCADLYFSCVRASHAVKIAKQLSVKGEEQNISCWDDSSAKSTSSRFPHRDESTKISISAGSFPQEQASVSSEVLPLPSDYVAIDKMENILTTPPRDSMKSFQGREYVKKQDGDHAGPVSASSEMESLDRKGSSSEVQPTEPHTSESFSILESPFFSRKSSLDVPFTPSPSQAVSSLSSNYNEFKSSTSSSPLPSHISVSEFAASSDHMSGSQGSSAAQTMFTISPKILLETDESGYGGGTCSAGASAMLDFMAEVCADLMTEQIKAVQALESILEMIPLYVDPECVLVFQGLCLSRVMNYLERRLLRDDEEANKTLDKRKWSTNLDAFCWMIVDRVYMGAFPQPTGVLKTLEFLLSILQLANKDGRVEEATSSGKGLLSIGRATRQLDAYVHSVLKNTNRAILYCFLPSFLTIIGEEDLLSRLGLLVESNKSQSSNLSVEESEVDISTVLQLLVANKNIIFCPSNLDRDVNCCLCVNLISLLHDQRKNVQNMASNIVRYLLVHRKSAFQDLLIKKPHRGKKVDVLHRGFDRILTENLPEFCKWLESSEQITNKVLEQGAAVMWKQYIAGSEKFPDVRMKGMDGRRTREMGRKSRDASKLDEKHWEQVSERRYALEIVRDAMSAELRVVRQNKYGSILYAESVWQTHLQQLVHERGIFPLRLSQGFEDKWQLCPIEGPYRMRKKLERCKLKIDSIHNLLEGKLELGEIELLKSKNEDGLVISDMDSEQAFLLSELYSESFFDEADDLKDFSSARNGWNNDRASSTNEASLQNALSFGGKSCSTASVPINVYTDAKSENGSPRNSSSGMDEIRAVEEESEKELNDDGDYLIRPYLEHLEKVKFQYNCERVVGLDKHDGIFLIGELCLYVIENFYIDDHGCICEKEWEDELSIIDQALGVTKQFTGSLESQSKSSTLWSTKMKTDAVGGRAWAYGGGAWGKEKVRVTGNLPHPRRMWKLDSVHEILKRDYELRPVAVEIFSMDGCNDLLVFHKKEREEVFRNLLAMNLPRNSMLDTTISGSAKQESKEGSRLFKLMAKSFTKRWQNGEISNFQYLMHLNTLAGRGYSDLTQYPVFPWILADYDSESLDLSDPKTFRKLDKPMGCQTPEGEEEFRKRYESWDDPEVPNFHYGSHYSSAGIVLFYLIRLPPFSAENQKLQGGQFDHADRLFNSIKETWLSAAGKGNTSDVKELIPEFFYMPEFLENRFYLDLGEKQSGEKVSNVSLPPWARGSVREFICKHRDALESDYVSENLHHWIDLIFGHKQRGKAAEKSVNVFYHYTYEGNVDVDAVTDPTLKASILAQINHFGQTPKQLFQKPHVKRRTDRKFPPHPLKHSMHLVPREIRKFSSSINQIITFNEKLLVAGSNCFLKPRGYKKYIRWGFPDMSLRFMSYDQDKLLSTHENLHEGNQIQCAGVSHDGRSVITGADDGLVSVWRVNKDGLRGSRRLRLEKSLCAHTAKVTCLRVSQPYMMIASGSDDCTVIIWDLSSLSFVRQLPNFPVPISAIYINDLTGEIITTAGSLLAVWSINGDCLSVVNTSQLPSDLIVSVTGSTFSDWLETTWYVTGHQSGALKVWQMVHCTDLVSAENKTASNRTVGIHLGDQVPEYKLLLHKELKFHKKPVTALHLTIDLKQLLSGDSAGHLLSWTVPDDILKASLKKAS
ncbi:PREDICTED: LOW QUALITY PROTEIN: BEACH domain-containing protein A2-like [Camelina sativa]|uniref:LOW QUALITY PROTEIN: BEACH domain-containing protein A2-like n=1 Tax=Camelina sativa TaxID=90675 RepID=A0ABM1QC75_CAMSA|nr:PREDICTED: LOW QUALITY PROTEIN: BEACH domain-containing protein A2-like [Camelina sativa]